MRLLITACLALSLLAGTASRAVAVIPSSIVHAGDRLSIEVAGEADLSQQVTVAGDGTIGLPLVGQVHVAGVTPGDAGNLIAAALKQYVRDPHVSVNVLQEGHIDVLVLGDVANSGMYSLPPGAHLSDAIAAAGGIDPSINGPYPVARVAIPDGAVYNVSLEKLLRGGDPTRDVELTNKAAVYVPGPTTFDITVLGAVDHPGTISLNQGDRLSIAVAKAGNSPTSNADLNRIVVTRTESNGKTASHPVNLYQALEQGDSRYDPPLFKGDVVYVPIAQQSHGNLTNALFILSRLFFMSVLL